VKSGIDLSVTNPNASLMMQPVEVKVFW